MTTPDRANPSPPQGPPPPVLFPFGDDPSTWCVGRLRLLGVRLQFHAILVLWMVAELVASLASRGYAGGLIPRDALIVVVVLPLLLVGREMARVVVARGFSSETPGTTIWPMGGLDSVGGAHLANPRLAEAGGLIFGFLAWPIFAGLVLLTGAGWDALVFNPLDAALVGSTLEFTVQAVVFWCYTLNAMLVIVNLFLPITGLDCGRIWMARLTARVGLPRASMIMGQVGLFTAGSLFVLASAADQTRVMGAAAAGGLFAWLEWRRVQIQTAPPPGPTAWVVPIPTRRRSRRGPQAGRSSTHTPQGPNPGAAPKIEGDRVGPPPTAGGRGKPPNRGGGRGSGGPRPKSRGVSPEGDPGAVGGKASGDTPGPTLDEVLAKVSRVGLAGLSEEERAVLTRETERRKRP